MNIVVTGSVAYDYLMSFPGYFHEHILPDKLEGLSLSFLVESMIKRRGGTAPNISYTLALLGNRPRMFATVGEDFSEYNDWLDEQGVDTSAVRIIPGEFTASFFVNTDRANAQIASFYPGAMAYAAELSFHSLGGERPDLVVISPNDPRAMIQYAQECRELGIPYLYDPSQQIVRLEAKDLHAGISGCHALFVNDYEFTLIQKKTGMAPEDILGLLEFMVITKGEQGAEIYSSGERYAIPIVQPDRIGDPTGVGDAFRGGFLTGFSRGWPWETCGQMGSLAATYCLEQRGPQSHNYTRLEYVTRFRKHFDDQSLLDVLVDSVK
jgi:adenosine kinase